MNGNATYKAGLVFNNSGNINLKNAYCLIKSGSKDLYHPLAYEYSSKATVNNSYWFGAENTSNDGLGTKVNTLEQMKQQSTFKGFDFTSGTIWKMGTYPELIFD